MNSLQDISHNISYKTLESNPHSVSHEPCKIALTPSPCFAKTVRDGESDGRGKIAELWFMSSMHAQLKGGFHEPEKQVG